MAEWTPDIEFDDERVATLIDSQFPDVRVRDHGITHIGTGWDNSVWRVGDRESRLAFRFVHRRVAIPLVQRELTFLGRLAPCVPLPVPAPVHVGDTTPEHPYPWFGFELVPGEEIGNCDLDEGARLRLGRTLGEFLKALHSATTLAVVDPDGTLPHDPNGRASSDFHQRGRTKIEELRAGDFGLTADELDAARVVIDATASLDITCDPVFVHGDLHIRHLLMSADGSASGVIDWGDSCRGPAGLDLTLYWSELTHAGRIAFREAYGDLDESHYVLGRACSVYLSAALAPGLREAGNHRAAQSAIAALRRTLA